MLVTVRWWFLQSRSNPAVNLEAAVLGSYSALTNIVYRGVKACPQAMILMRTTVQVWERVTAAVKADNTVSPHTPLWGNPKLSHFRSVPDPSVWARFGVVKLQQIMPNGVIHCFRELKETFQLPSWMLFCYLQLKHASQAQFPTPISVIQHVVERFLISRGVDRVLSSLYLHLTCDNSEGPSPLFHAWKADIPSLTEEEWDLALQQYIATVVSAKDRFIQLKFIHRAYYTPQRLAKIYSTQSETCGI